MEQVNKLKYDSLHRIHLLLHLGVSTFSSQVFSPSALISSIPLSLHSLVATSVPSSSSPLDPRPPAEEEVVGRTDADVTLSLANSHTMHPELLLRFLFVCGATKSGFCIFLETNLPCSLRPVFVYVSF